MESNLENLEELFKKMNNDNFDTTSILKWGFYFYGQSQETLQKVWVELTGHDYNLEELVDSEGEWKLLVTKLDILTPLKLHKRNIAFNELAKFCGADLYDGWDVERI
ncbi:ribonuclease E inhibitor RraB [Dyadobacter subterraneus]|uniref:Ribonuclease E inhibitor RraB n=1 Tax=Dyadobacter subterraneus TaxID=2773304 RepID=A0ABR9WM97_9BACT|nr:ribonuclease E inhibitor RraB [Dyadobacter subterraneus]MBE9466634.1 ribonuclease E inhibitor RraB [Dyadobacter subterraneus]